MSEKKVKLYGMWASPFSNRVEIALKLKGIDYEYIEEDIYNKSPDLLKYNPVHKKIPVLVHGDKAIAESQVIIEYIDETWDSGVHILPKDPYQRTQARFWARFIDDKLMPSLFKTIFQGDSKVIEEALENLRTLDVGLEGKRFFGGESVGFVDIVANFIGFWLGVVEEEGGEVFVTKEAFPWICKWQYEFVNSDEVQPILPQREKLAIAIKSRIEALRSQTSQ